MRSSVSRALAVVLAAGALVAVESTAAFASDQQRGEFQQVVHVTGTGSSVRLDHSAIRAGSIQFKVGSTADATQGMSSSITLFKPRPGKTKTQVLRDFLDEFSRDPATAAKGTRELTCDATFYGLADVAAGNPMMVTENLDPGSYFAVDLGTPPAPGALPKATELDVSGDRRGVEQDSDLRSSATVAAVEPDRFAGPNAMPHQGTLTFVNKSDTLHFLNLTPVLAGTTAAQVVAALNDPNASGPPSFAVNGPSGGSDVISPGGSLQLSYNLPKGTYAMLCFVADDQTGMPHAMMGMVKIVTLY